MRTLGFLVTGVMAAAIVACAGSTDSSSSGSSDLTNDDASVPTDGGAAPVLDATAPDASAVDAGPAIPTYEQVAPIIQAACATSCHKHDGEFSDKLSVVENAASMLSMLSRGKMPKDNTSFKNTPDGQTLITYLTSSPDVQ